MVELLTVNQEGVGSSPTYHPNKQCCVGFLVRSPVLQTGETGSIPVRNTKSSVLCWVRHKYPHGEQTVKICPKCKSEHNKTGKFCSRSCANSRSWNDADKMKKSISAKTSEAHKKAQIDRQKKRTYVRTQPPSKTHNPRGGYRENSGRGKRGFYKGIYCASTYELVWVIYRIDHNLPVQRFTGYIEYEQGKYFPDFIDGNCIFEIKGYWTESVDEKAQAAQNAGYNIVLLYKKDLKKEFDWARAKYGCKSIEEIHTLYDDYKPEYNYQCGHCKQPFMRTRKIKTEVKFCSRSCAGKGHTGRMKKNQWKVN